MICSSCRVKNCQAGMSETLLKILKNRSGCKKCQANSVLQSVYKLKVWEKIVNVLKKIPRKNSIADRSWNRSRNKYTTQLKSNETEAKKKCFSSKVSSIGCYDFYRKTLIAKCKSILISSFIMIFETVVLPEKLCQILPKKPIENLK